MIRAGRLDEAEHAAQDLLEQYPEVTTVSNALRWSTPPAVTARVPAEDYRQAADLVHAHADQYDSEMEIYLRDKVTVFDAQEG